MDKYIIAPPSGSTNNGIGAEDRPWAKGHFNKLPGWQEYLAESTGYGIVSGCEPSISGLTVTVGAGIVHLADGTRKEIAQTNITLDAADSTNPRIDLVYIDSTGAVSKITGTAAASPSVPALPSGGISVCTVSVAANAVTGTINRIQTVLPTVAGLGVVNVHDFGAVGDGVTDDTVAVQAAINYAIANKKSLLVEGICYITSPLVVNRQVDVSTYSEYFYITSINGGGFKIDSAISLFTTTLPFTNTPVSQLVNFVNITFAGNNNSCYVLDGGKFLRIVFNNCTFKGIRAVNSSIYLQSIYFISCNMRYLTGPFYSCDNVSYDLKVNNCICEGITGNIWEIGAARGCCFNGNVIEGASTAIKYTSAYGLAIVGNYFEENTVDIDGTGTSEKRGVSLVGNHFLSTVDTYTIKWGTNAFDCVSLGNYHNKNMHSIPSGNVRDILIKDYAGVSVYDNEPCPMFDSLIAVNDGDLITSGYAGVIKGYGVTGDGVYLELGIVEHGTYNSCAKMGENFFGIQKGLRLTSQTTATSATAGTATLPSNPDGFLSTSINGTSVKIPYYKP